MDADFIYFETHEPDFDVFCRGTVFLALCIILTGFFMTSDQILGTPTAQMLTLFFMGYTSYRGVRYYGWFYGLEFGFLLSVTLIIAFRMIGFVPRLTFKVLEKLVLGTARF